MKFRALTRKQRKGNNLLLKTPLFKKPVRSGGSRSVTIVKRRLPFEFKHKGLKCRVVNYAGRGNLGRILVRTKGSKYSKHNLPWVNYVNRTRRAGFVGSFSFIPFLNKFVSSIFYSSGVISHNLTTTEHQLLLLTCSISAMRHIYIRSASLQLYKQSKPESPFPTPFIFTQLPKNRSVCLLERLPYEGVKYARSVGVSAKIVKMDSRTSIGVVILPSGLYKIFSIYSLGSIGKVLPLETRKFKNTKAGAPRLAGFKSVVRGVAMNPTDHPHGGRTKTLRYPRTPWGKTTKLK